jgi:CheY-like chemotaxis protein
MSSKPLKILLVEDERIAMIVHSKMLEKLGYIPDSAEDGQAALALAANGYDVILMDIGLPDMTGIEATAAIRQREDGSHKAHIVGVTAYVLEEVEEKCLAAGMDKVIAKPMSAEKLVEILATAAGKTNL